MNKEVRIINKIKKLFLFLIACIWYLLFSLPAIHAQVPSDWQNNATGLKTASNTDKNTAGLATIIKASGIPFISLQGGVQDAGSWMGPRLKDTMFVQLGEIKAPGTSPAITSELADWSHNEMNFSSNLKVWVSRLSPAALIQNLNTSLRLFSGNLSGGATIVPGSSVGQPWNPIVVKNTNPAPAFPKYIAYSTANNIEVKQLPASTSASLALPVLDNDWILVWYVEDRWETVKLGR